MSDNSKPRQKYRLEVARDGGSTRIVPHTEREKPPFNVCVGCINHQLCKTVRECAGSQTNSNR